MKHLKETNDIRKIYWQQVEDGIIGVGGDMAWECRGYYTGNRDKKERVDLRENGQGRPIQKEMVTDLRGLGRRRSLGWLLVLGYWV